MNIKEGVDFLLGIKSYTSTNEEYHFSMAKDYYIKTNNLHKAGAEYKKAIRDLIYLEDDFNDNAFHFGASIDRYLMINNVFNKNIDEC